MKKRTVYPVEGRWLNDRPHVEHECDDPFCVESGAFSYTKPKAAKTPEPDEPAEPESEE